METTISIGHATVVNYYTDCRRGKSKRYNTNPRQMKYVTAENAQWMADTLNYNGSIFHWYIANA